MDAAKCRQDFSIPEDIVYFNCSYMGPQLKKASEQGIQEISRKETPWKYTREDFFIHVQRLQQNMGRLLNVEPHNIALTPSVSYGISTAAQGVLYYSDPGEILILDQQFPSNVYPWVELKKHGYQLKILQRNTQEDLTTQVLESIDTKTKVVAIGQCHWADGHMLDIEKIGAECRARNIFFLIDGIQSVGVVPTDVRKSQAHYFAGGMYKWLLGPYGLSYLYIDENYCESPALDSTWMSRLGADKFASLTDYNLELLQGAQKYTMGGKSSFIHVAIANETIEYLLDLGIENIQDAARAKTDYLADWFQKKGFQLIPQEFRAPHILSVKNPNGVWTEEFQEKLRTKNVHVSFRGDYMRMSPNFFNTQQDLERFLKVMAEVL